MSVAKSARTALVHHIETIVSDGSKPTNGLRISSFVERLSSLPKGCSSTYRELRISEVAKEYEAAERLYEVLKDDTKRGRINQLRECRTLAYFARNDLTGEVRVRSSHCQLRWCPLCGRSRRNFIVEQVATRLRSVYRPRFATFTLKHSDAPLEHQINSLYNYFRQLRRRFQFKRLTRGGIWFFQIKRYEKTGAWHPHIHCLLDGQYIEQSALSAEWKKITYGSYIVDIRAVHNKKNAAEEVARYAAMPCNLAVISDSAAVEIAEALQGKRLAGTWGSLRNIRLHYTKTPAESTWVNVGWYTSIMELIDTDINAQSILLSWLSGEPLPPATNIWHVDSPPPVISHHSPPERWLF
jgi:hypothetical protein